MQSKARDVTTYITIDVVKSMLRAPERPRNDVILDL